MIKLQHQKKTIEKKGDFYDNTETKESLFAFNAGHIISNDSS